MAKTPINRRAPWTPKDVKDLKQLAKENTPTRVIGLKMGRTPEAVQSKATTRAFPSSRQTSGLTIGANRNGCFIEGALFARPSVCVVRQR